MGGGEERRVGESGNDWDMVLRADKERALQRNTNLVGKINSNPFNFIQPVSYLMMAERERVELFCQQLLETWTLYF